jgi:hypothetical protein
MKARLYYLRRRTGKAAVAIKEKDRAAEIHAAKVAAYDSGQGLRSKGNGSVRGEP